MAEVMTDDPLTVSTTEDLGNCLALMRRHGFRHLPVCHEGHLVGIVSLRDILLHDLDEDDEVMMRAYIRSMPDASNGAAPDFEKRNLVQLCLCEEILCFQR